MKTFDDWWNSEDETITFLPPDSRYDTKSWCKQAFNAGVAAGTANAEKATAERCIDLIIRWEGTWSVLDFKDAIVNEFNLEE